MVGMVNQRIILTSRPEGMPKESDFRLVESEIPTMADGDILAETLYLSVDPYMRGLLREKGTYTQPVELGGTMKGGGVARVLRSNSAKFQEGDIVVGMTGWQRYAMLPSKDLRKVDPSLAPISTALGVLGMPGLTAYFGLIDICDPKPGETVFVSGAAGAVGSIVGQIAKILRCRVVGSAGSDEKISLLVNEFGFDSAFNYKKGSDLAANLRKHCPDGIDIYFDNVGGAMTDAVFPQLNTFARISVCGQIDQYNDSKPSVGPRLLWYLIAKQAKAQGFLITQYSPRYHEAIPLMAQWLGEGKLKYRETIVEGLEKAPNAFIGLFHGENTGKMLVKVAD
jgi:NADPH-dependent curcumin reductase CurA